MVTNYLTKNDSFVPVDVPRNNIMDNLKSTVNEYVGKFLKKLSSQNGFYFQCQLCPHKSAKKKVVLHHFLTIHSEHYASKEIKQKMDEMKLNFKQKEVLMNLPNCDSTNLGVSLVECKGCQKSLQPLEYSSHLKSCKVFSRFIKKTSTGFQCQVCLKIGIKKWEMLNHFTTMHGSLHKAAILSNDKGYKEYLKKKLEMKKLSNNDGEIVKLSMEKVLEKPIEEQSSSDKTNEKQPETSNEIVELLMEKPIEILNLQSEHKIMKSKDLRIILERVELQFESLKSNNTVYIMEKDEINEKHMEAPKVKEIEKLTEIQSKKPVDEHMEIEVLKNDPIILFGSNEGKVQCKNCNKSMTKNYYLNHLRTCDRYSNLRKTKLQQDIQKMDNQYLPEKLLENGSKKECAYCLDVVEISFHSKHEKACKCFTQFITHTEQNYSCNICSVKFPQKPRRNFKETILRLSYLHKINDHIKTRHSDIVGNYLQSDIVEVSDFSDRNTSNDDSKNEQPLEKIESRKSNKKKCENCNENILVYHYHNHVNLCKLYFKHIRKVDDWYQCSICLDEFPGSSSIFSHMSKNHFDDKNVSNPNQMAFEFFGINEMTSLKPTEIIEFPTENPIEIMELPIQKPIIETVDLTSECDKESRDLHILNLPNFVNPNPGVSLVECKGCHNSIQPSEYSSHLKSCKVFTRFVKRTSDGFQCQVCLKKDIKKWVMLNHFTAMHSMVHKASILSNDKGYKEYLKKKMKMKKLSNNDCEIVELPMEKPISKQKNMKSKKVKIVLKRIEHQFESIRNGSKTVQILDKVNEKSYCAINGSKQIGTDPKIVDKEVHRCHYCQEMIKNSSYKFHTVMCKAYNKYLVKIPDGYRQYECSICSSKSKDMVMFFNHMRNKHAEISKGTNSNFLRIDDSSEESTQINNENMEWEVSTGNISDNIIVKNETEVEELKTEELLEQPQSRIQDSNGQEVETMEIASKFIKERLCLICDVESESTSEAVKHMKEYHMSIISEQSNQKLQDEKLKNEYGNVSLDLKIQDVFQVRNLSNDVVVKELFELDSDSQILPQLNPNEILDKIESSSKFICQLCFVSYVTLQDLESHLSSFHRISLQSCRSKVVNFSKPEDVNL